MYFLLKFSTLRSQSRCLYGMCPVLSNAAQTKGLTNKKHRPKNPIDAGKPSQGYLHNVPLFSKQSSIAAVKTII